MVDGDQYFYWGTISKLFSTRQQSNSPAHEIKTISRQATNWYFKKSLGLPSMVMGSSIFTDPAGIYLLKVSNRSTRTRCEVCSKLTRKTPEWCHWHNSGVFIGNFEDISDHSTGATLLISLEMIIMEMSRC